MIVQTAHGGIDNVVSAMRAGATDFVVKPASAERLQVRCAMRWPRSALAGELQRLKRRHEGTLTHRRRDHALGGHAARAQGGGKGGRLRDIRF